MACREFVGPGPMLLGFVALMATACRGGCDPDLPVPSDPIGTESALAKVPAPEIKQLRSEWAAVSKNLSVRPVDKPSGDPAYTLSQTELRYQARFVQTNRFAANRPPVGTQADLAFVVRPDEKRNARQVLTLSKLVLSRLAEGQQSLMNRQPDRSFAPVLLRTSGEQWMEEDGPTSLWSGFGTFPNLRRFFPTLPEDGEIGGIRAWKILTYAGRSTMPVERRRGGLKRAIPPTPPPAPRIDHATVTLLEQMRLTSPSLKKSRRAWMLQARWAIDRKTEPPRPRDELARYLGFFVLLDSGELLYARLVGNKLNRWSVRPGEQNEQRGEDQHELRLVGADHGVVLPPFDVK